MEKRGLSPLLETDLIHFYLGDPDNELGLMKMIMNPFP